MLPRTFAKPHPVGSLLKYAKQKLPSIAPAIVVRCLVSACLLICLNDSHVYALREDAGVTIEMMDESIEGFTMAHFAREDE